MPRLVRRLVMLLLTILATLMLRTAAAQEFRVFTAVYDVSAATGDGLRPPAVSRSLTLFHAGKVYDFVDAAGQVVIYEPNARRFRVLNPSRNLVTTAAVDEVTQLLKIGREETEKFAAQLTADPKPESAKTLAFLRVQLDPRFSESFDEAGGGLTLDGGALRYVAQTLPVDRPGVVAAYLDYADRVGRLNYVLHPGPLLPDPRLAVNQALRTRDRLPVSIELRAEITPPLHLRAEHKFDWQLDVRDRGLIHQWEVQLKSDAIREVTLRDYQREVYSTPRTASTR